MTWFSIARDVLTVIGFVTVIGFAAVLPTLIHAWRTAEYRHEDGRVQR